MKEYYRLMKKITIKKIIMNVLLFLLYGFIAACCLGLIFPLKGWLLLLIPVGIFFFLKGTLRAQDIAKHIEEYKELKN
jgi:hypothetical protein